jgi:hypothetical protein
MAHADSYPADKPYQARAYRRAAEGVRTWNYELYKDYVYAVPGVGPRIGEFIEDFIKMFPNTESYLALCKYVSPSPNVVAAPPNATAAPPNLVAAPKNYDDMSAIAKTTIDNTTNTIDTIINNMNTHAPFTNDNTIINTQPTSTLDESIKQCNSHLDELSKKTTLFKQYLETEFKPYLDAVQPSVTQKPRRNVFKRFRSWITTPWCA